MAARKSVKAKGKKKGQEEEEPEVNYPIEGCIILMHDAIDEKELLRKVLKNNKVSVIDEIEVAFDKDRAKEFINNDLETWTMINDYNSTPSGTTNKKGKGKKPPPKPKSAAKGKKSPKNNKSEEETKEEEELGPEKCLIGKKVIVWRIEGIDVTRVTNNIFGPYNPAEWVKLDPTPIRSLIKSDYNVTIYVSKDNETSSKDIKYFFIPTVTVQLEPKKPVPNPHQDEEVYIEDVMDFIFPPDLIHPDSTYRMFIYADIGPFYYDGKFYGGRHGNHKINNTDITALVESFKQQDIKEIYMGKHTAVSMLEMKQIYANADGRIKYDPPFTREYIENLFANIPSNENGKVSFHDVQKIILEVREERIRQFKKMYPDIVVKTQIPEPLTDMHTSYNFPKVDDIAVFHATSHLLTIHGHEVVTLDKCNDTNAIANVRLLRDNNAPLNVGRKALNFDTTSCVKGTQKGSYVNTHKY